LWYYAQTYWFQGNFRLQVVGAFALFWWIFGGAIAYFGGGTEEGENTLSEHEQETPGNRPSSRPEAARKSFYSLRDHVFLGAVRLQALPAGPEGLGDADIPPGVLEWALPELAEVGARLDALAEKLGEAVDPAAAGR
jgi:hypothetical protein